MNTPQLQRVQLDEVAETRPLGLYASWGARLGALFIDALLLAFVSRILGGILNDSSSGFFPVSWVLEVPMAALYFPLCHSLAGQTVGKAAVGLKVFDSASLGRLSLGRAFLRWVVTFAFWIPVLPGVLDGFSPLWNEDSNQAWHDKIARSVVMRVRGSGQGAGTAVPQKPLRTERMWTSPLLKGGSIAALALGIVGIPVTLIVALDRSLARGEPNDMFNIDSPAVSHEKLVTAISIGGVTVGLFVLAVLLGAVQMRRNGLPLRLVELILVAAAGTGAAAVVLAAIPGTRDWGIPVGLVSILSLIVCWVWVLALLRRVRGAEA